MRIVRLLARRLRSRLGLVKSANVLYHGADPRGRWDSTKAFQRAVGAVGLAASPPVASGTYRISDTIKLRDVEG